MKGQAKHRSLTALLGRPWFRSGVWVTAGLLPGVLTGTCFAGGKSWCCIDNCATIPRGAIAQPLGQFVHKWQDVQCAKAEVDDFVIYKYMWFKGGTELGPFGVYTLQQIIKRLPTVPFPVLIQCETDPVRNEERRKVIVNYLAQAGVPDPDPRVVLGFPEAEGLYGEQAPLIYRRMLMGFMGNQNQFGTNFAGGAGVGFPGLNTVPGGGTFGGFGGPAVGIPPNLP